MASKVNKKFVITLVGALIVVAGLAVGAAVFVSMRDGERNVRQGDAFAAQNDWERAAEAYSRAVNKDQSRVDWMEKWRDALRKHTPKNQTAFREDYGKLRGSLLKIAQTKKTDVPAYQEFFEFVLKEAQAFGDSRGMWDAIASEADKAIKTFELEKVSESAGWGVLRRYRGIAGVSVAEQDQNFTGAPLELAKADLEAALKLDPKDVDSSFALVRWHLVQAERAKAAGLTAEAKAAMDKARSVMAVQSAALPEDPRTQVDAVRLEAMLAQQDLPTLPTVAQMIRERQKALQSVAPKLAALHGIIARANLGTMPTNVVQNYISIVQQVDPKNAPTITKEFLDKVQAAQPDNAEVAFVAARAALQRRDIDAANRGFERVVAIPNKPVSLEGQQLSGLKVAAMIQQASLALGQVGMAQNAEDRQAGLVKAKAMREKLSAETLATQSPEMLFLDAKIKIAENDIVAGQQLLADYSKKTNDIGPDAIEALLLQGAIAQQRNELGRAREAFEKVLQRNPGANVARMNLANISQSLGDYNEALRLYEDALVLDPDNQELQTAARVTRAAVAGDPTALKDPVEKVLVEADRLRRVGGPQKNGDMPAAMNLVEKELEPNKFDPRLVEWFLGAAQQRDERDRAVAMLKKAVAARPDEERFKQVLAQIEKPPTAAELVAQIKASKLSDPDKAYQTFRVLSRDGQKAEASQVIRDAIDAGHINREVLEVAFVQAFEAADLARAQAMVDKARTLNIDQAEGQTFQARFALMQGKTAEAEAILNALVTRGAPPAAVYRLLSNVRSMQGKKAEALAAIEDALRIQPNDLEAQKQQIRLLDSMDRAADALAVARKLEDRGALDPDIAALMLDLQTKTGDRAGTLSRRQKLFDENPKDIANATALAEMYLADSNYAKAKVTIDAAKASAPAGTPVPLAVTGLEARLYAAQGDQAAARRVFDEAIAAEAKAPKPRPDPSLALAKFLADQGKTDEALQIYEKARPLQDPWAPVVDASKAEMLTRAGRGKDAIEIYRAMVAPGSGVQQTVEIRRRLIELYLSEGRPGDAEQELAAFEKEGNKELAVYLLKMRVKQDQGDLAGARAAGDAAVAAFPSEALAYYNRAILLQNDPKMVRDAMLDLDMAVKLRPGFAQALRARGLLKFADRDVEGGLQDLKAAANADPSQTELRVALVTELLNRQRDLEAVQAANDGLNARADDIGLALTLGDLFSSRKQWRQAQEIYGNLWNRLKIPAAAERYSISLLRGEPVRLPQAEQVLASPEAKAPENWGLMILRAELRSKQGNEKAAQADIGSAMGLAVKTPGMESTVFEFLRAAFPKPGQLSKLLAGVTRVPTGAELWIPAYQARLRFDEAFAKPGGPDSAITQDALKMLDAVEAATAKMPQQPSFMYMLSRVRSEMNMAIGRYEESIAAGKKALEAVPNDAMINNNVAYMLAEKLKKPAEALPYIEKAIQVAGNRADIQDTLGTVHLGLNQPEQAVAAFQRALSLTPSTADRVLAGSKLVRALVQAGRKPVAVEVVRQIRAWRDADPKARERLSDAEFEELVRLTER